MKRARITNFLSIVVNVVSGIMANYLSKLVKLGTSLKSLEFRVASGAFRSELDISQPMRLSVGVR